MCLSRLLLSAGQPSISLLPSFFFLASLFWVTLRSLSFSISSCCSLASSCSLAVGSSCRSLVACCSLAVGSSCRSLVAFCSLGGEGGRLLPGAQLLLLGLLLEDELWGGIVNLCGVVLPLLRHRGVVLQQLILVLLQLLLEDSDTY